MSEQPTHLTIMRAIGSVEALVKSVDDRLVRHIESSEQSRVRIEQELTKLNVRTAVLEATNDAPILVPPAKTEPKLNRLQALGIMVAVIIGLPALVRIMDALGSALWQALKGTHG